MYQRLFLSILLIFFLTGTAVAGLSGNEAVSDVALIDYAEPEISGNFIIIDSFYLPEDELFGSATTTTTILYDGYSLVYSLNDDTSSATVTNITNVTKSRIDVVVPENITVDNVTYDVTRIRETAFANGSFSYLTPYSRIFNYYDRTDIASVDCPSVKFLGFASFVGCINLRTANCPNVTNIPQDCFKDCSGLRSISCPDITNINSGAFSGCYNLTEINISESNPYYYTDSFALFENNTSGDVLYIFLGKNETMYAIPENVTNINSSAFSHCSNLISVNCSNVTSISSNAFSNCSNLTYIDCLNVTSISSNAFVGCYNLTEINISESNPCYYTDSFALFENNTSGTILHTFLGKNATTYTIPEDVTTINSYAFGWCNNLTFVACPNVMNISSYAFYYCRNLTSIDCPNVTNIDSYAFYGCRNLTFIDCPNVTNIGSYAFEWCSNLTSIDCPNVTSIGSSAFYFCDNLVSGNFPNVTSVGSYTFDWCPNLTSIVLSSDFKLSYGYVFFSCPNLTAVYFMGPSLSSNINSSMLAYNVSQDIVYYRSSEYPDFDWQNLNGTKGVFDPNELYSVISFDANGGTGPVMPSESKLNGTAIRLPECSYTKNRSNFLYWSLSPEGNETAYYPGDLWTVSGNETFYARWSRIPSDGEIRRADDMITGFVCGDGLDLSYDYTRDGIVDGRDLIVYQQMIW